MAAGRFALAGKTSCMEENTPTPITGGVGFVVKAAVPHNRGGTAGGFARGHSLRLEGKVDARRADG